MKRYKTILLDIDGTLIDSNDAQAQAWKEALFDAGQYVPFHKIRQLIGMSPARMLSTLTELAPESPEGRDFLAHRSQLFLTRYLSRVQPFPHVGMLLERMSEEGYQMIAVSTAVAAEREALLARVDRQHLLTRVALPDDLFRTTADMLGAALWQSATSAHATILIGDTSYDIEAAAVHGLDTLIFRSGGSPERTLRGALEVYDDPMDLLENFASSPLGR